MQNMQEHRKISPAASGLFTQNPGGTGSPPVRFSSGIVRAVLLNG